MTPVLGVDVGKTGCRAGLPGGVVTEVTGAPGLAMRDGVEQCADAVRRAVTAALEAAHQDHVGVLAVGAAGALAAPQAAEELGRRLFGSLSVDAVAVASDAVTSHAGTLGGAPGVVLAIGTGAVALGLAPDGRYAVVDGWGPGLGDEGSGAWIGYAGLQAALRAHDGRGPATALHDAARDSFGDLACLPAHVYGYVEGESSPARVAASFAPDVSGLAAAGDEVAVRILDAAVAALTETVQTASRLAGGVDALAVTGGLALDPMVVGPLLDALPEMQAQPAAGGSLHGAWLVAERTDLPHESLVVRLG